LALNKRLKIIVKFNTIVNILIIEQCGGEKCGVENPG